MTELFTTLAFNLCAVLPPEPVLAVHIGEIVNGRCRPQMALTDTNGQETLPAMMQFMGKRGPVAAHRWQIAIFTTEVIITLDGQEFRVPRGQQL